MECGERLIPLANGTVSKSRNGQRVPFSIFHLRFDIGHCRRRPRFNVQCSLSYFRAMTNVKSHMANGKCLSFLISRFTDGTGSGSDLAPAITATYEGARSLPLPVPYRSPNSPAVSAFRRFAV